MSMKPMARVERDGNDNNNAKRIKTNDDGAVGNALAIDDLPDAVMCNVATYLEVPSRALFAVALTAPPSSHSEWANNGKNGNDVSAASKVVLSTSSWEVLDFVDVDRRLAERLDDNDLRSILVCTGAVNKLKRLILTNCNKIQGNGLEPLRGSIVLEQMDLSLIEVYHECPPIPSLSLEIVPILASIVDKEGSVIRHIDLPPEFCKRQVRPNFDELQEVLRRYDQLLQRRRTACSKCGDVFHDPAQDTIRHTWISYGFYRINNQQYTCCRCCKHFCNKKPQCSVTCDRCNREHCRDCTSQCDSCKKSDRCAVPCDEADCGLGCGQRLCKDCVETCGQCNKTGCDDCLNNFHRCPNCGIKGLCGECYEGESVDGDTMYCEDCGYVEKSDY